MMTILMTKDRLETATNNAATVNSGLTGDQKFSPEDEGGKGLQLKL